MLPMTVCKTSIARNKSTAHLGGGTFPTIFRHRNHNTSENLVDPDFRASKSWLQRSVVLDGQAS